MGSEFSKLNSLLGQIGQLKQTLLKLLGLLGVFIELANLLLANNLRLEPPLDDIPPDLLDTIDK